MRIGVALALAMLLGVPAAADSAPLGLEDCEPAHGAHQCSGQVRTWDGVPLDATVILPEAGARRLPLVVAIHGLGNSKHAYLDPDSEAYAGNAFGWARRGYAVLAYTARGLWGSCGTPESRLASPDACASGYLRLADVRYEVRDTQELVGRLVDQGVADPRRIGVTGDSYGGGQSLMLAALNDRVMLPGGRLVRWRSPAGRPLEIAAAAPVIPWSDLITAAAPNGRVFSHAVTPRRVAVTPVGVAKATVVNAIFAAAQFAIGPGQPTGEPFVPGRPIGFLAPPGHDPEADVAGWVTRTNRGEPYTDPEARAIVRLLARYHSAYYIDHSRRPAPLLLAAGFTDDLFPVDEVLRFANRTLLRYPRAPLALMLGDFGHQRASNKPPERRALLRAIRRWFDRHLRGRGRGSRAPVTAYVQRCPRSVPPGRAHRATSFARLARGEVRRRFAGPEEVSSASGDPAVGAAVDPATGGGDGCVEVPARQSAGTATFEVPVDRPGGITLIGAPTIAAALDVRGAPPDVAQVGARLWDVDPAGETQRLVARGSYRPSASEREAWQLHPAAWRFARGHRIKLELLGSDAPFGRPSNASFEIDVRGLRLRLPVRQRPDCTHVLPPRRLPLLAGQRRAPATEPRRRPPAC